MLELWDTVDDLWPCRCHPLFGLPATFLMERLGRRRVFYFLLLEWPPMKRLERRKLRLKKPDSGHLRRLYLGVVA